MNRSFRGLALLAAALLAPAFARAEAEPEFGGALPAFDFAAARPLAAPPPPGTSFLVAPSALGAPAAVIDLAPLLDNLRGTAAVFRVGGVVVHVYGEKSADKGDWFIGFAEDGADAQFRNGRKMIHWYLLHRTVHFTAGGKSFSSYIQGDLSDRMQSRLVVSADDHSQPDASWSIQQITDDGYEAGRPVAIGGRDYRLFYARDFRENGDGTFGGYTGNRSIVLVGRDGDRFTAYHWRESDIPQNGVLAVTEKPAYADQPNTPPLQLGLRLSGGRLEIYDRSGVGAVAVR